MELTNLQALLHDQKAGSGSEWTSHQLAFRLPSTRHSYLTDGLGGARNGWPKYYWKPWKKYRARQKKK
jgi:hypothetical protein